MVHRREVKDETTSSKKAICKASIKHFGLTIDPREVGFILEDGKMLDFSGKRIGGSPGTRTLDHRDIGAIHDSLSGGTEGMLQFMDICKTVRFTLHSGDVLNFDSIHRLTDPQISSIARALPLVKDMIAERSSKRGESLCSMTQKFPRGNHVLAFRTKCWGS